MLHFAFQGLGRRSHLASPLFLHDADPLAPFSYGKPAKNSAPLLTPFSFLRHEALLPFKKSSIYHPKRGSSIELNILSSKLQDEHEPTRSHTIRYPATGGNPELRQSRLEKASNFVGYIYHNTSYDCTVGLASLYPSSSGSKVWSG